MTVLQFAAALRDLLDTRSAREFESLWHARSVPQMGRRVLARARRHAIPNWESALDELDGQLLRLLDRLPILLRGRDPVALTVASFRVPQLQRFQHAVAAALVACRYGVAGLTWVLDDEDAPVARRYFAFLTLAVRHPTGLWPLFRRYLRSQAHHAFLGAATEAARFYPQERPSPDLIALFDAVRDDMQLREFLSPRILESLYVLNAAESLDFLRRLLTAGHTHAALERCEVTRALVAVRRLTGAIEPNAKFRAAGRPDVARLLDRAERRFRRLGEVIRPVELI
jgi:hypothetical protein